MTDAVRASNALLHVARARRPTPDTLAELDSALLSAYERGAVEQITDLYRDAAEAAPHAGQRAFFLTQAYIIALEAGLPCFEELRSELVQMGREG